LLPGDNPIFAIGFWADFRRLILHLAITPSTRLRFELVAALSGFCAYFFGGLALSFLLFGLPVDFSLLMSAWVSAFCDVGNFNKDRLFPLGVKRF
jgi:hypothetical protein